MPSLTLRGGPIERIVRPAIVIESHLRDRSPAPVEVPEDPSEDTWGGPSSFQWSTTNPPTNDGGVTVIDNSGDNTDDDPDAPPGPVKVIFDEVAKDTQQKAVRVYNKDDHDQYVDVASILKIDFRGPQNLFDILLAQRNGHVTDVIYEYALHPEDRPEPPAIS